MIIIIIEINYIDISSLKLKTKTHSGFGNAQHFLFLEQSACAMHNLHCINSQLISILSKQVIIEHGKIKNKSQNELIWDSFYCTKLLKE